ncbi:MAG TPA: hypothetical protein VGS06_41605 [Streptosporangiaceae bacterium]|nr:hypothetical protein [Streptosporangiaceae bacterium]
MSPRDEALEYVRTYINKWIISMFALAAAFPLTALALFCASLPHDRWLAYGTAVMVLAGSFFAGGLLGFLFGIPRAMTRHAKENPGVQSERLIANTNLEDVSDWLTKIIIGATLVQLGSIPRRFGQLVTFASSIFGNPSGQNKAMAGSIILYAAILGFLVIYLAARSIVVFLFYLSPSDWIPERQGIQAETDTGEANEPHVELRGSARPDP